MKLLSQKEANETQTTIAETKFQSFLILLFGLMCFSLASFLYFGQDCFGP